MSEFKVRQFLEPIIKTTLEVITTTASTSVKIIDLSIKKKNEVSGDISAIVPINSTTVTGSFAICFEKACFLEIVSNMFGEPYTEITQENQDAVMEICNQVFSNSKSQINDTVGMDIAMAIPSLVIGEKHTIQHQSGGDCLIARFKTEKGLFTIEMCLKP